MVGGKYVVHAWLATGWNLSDCILTLVDTESQTDAGAIDMGRILYNTNSSFRCVAVCKIDTAEYIRVFDTYDEK